MINGSMEYKHKVYEVLNTFDGFILDHVDYNGTMVARCPFCGDSKDTSHGHLYILGLNADSEYDPNYYCQKCRTQGFIDNFFLDLMNLYDSDLELLARKHKINKSKNKSKTGLKENNKIISKLMPPLNNSYTVEKIKMFEDRMGIKLTTQKILDYRMVFNLKDYLDYNNVRGITRHKMMIDVLDKQYLGFLSINSEFINMRNLGEINKYNLRYENYNVYGIQDNTKRFYIISNKIDVTRDVTINIAEGVYDIIGIREHIFNCEDDNVIYAACLGVGYNNLIKYFTKKGILFGNYNIYSDSGIPISEYREMKRELKSTVFGEFNVYYNTNPNMKDYGTTKDNIKLKKYTV